MLRIHDVNAGAFTGRAHRIHPPGWACPRAAAAPSRAPSWCRETAHRRRSNVSTSLRHARGWSINISKLLITFRRPPSAQPPPPTPLAARPAATTPPSSITIAMVRAPAPPSAPHAAQWARTRRPAAGRPLPRGLLVLCGTQRVGAGRWRGIPLGTRCGRLSALQDGSCGWLAAGVHASMICALHSSALTALHRTFAGSEYRR